MSASVLQVFVMRDGQLVASEMFAEGLYTLGSEPDCDLVLLDPAVAGVHASLQFQGSTVELTDNESQTGLIINGAAVPSAQVRSSDDVRVGPFLIKTRVVGRKPGLRAPGAAASLPPPVVQRPPPAPPAPKPPAPAAPPLGARPPVSLPPPARPAAPGTRTGTARPIPPPPRPPAPPPPAAPPGARPTLTTPPRPLPPAPALRSVPPPPPAPPGPRAAPSAPATQVARAPAGRPAVAVVPRLAAEQPAPLPVTPPAPEAAPALATEDLLEDIDFLFDQALERHATEGAPATRPGVTPAGLGHLGEGVVELSAESAAEAHGHAPAPVALAPALLGPDEAKRVTPRPPAPQAPLPAAARPPSIPTAPAPRPPPATAPTAPPAPLASPAAAAPTAAAPAAGPPAPAAPPSGQPLPLAAAAQAPAAASRVKTSKSGEAGGGLVLHARVFWGDALLYARSFTPEAAVFTTAGDTELLSTYGFAPAPGAALVKLQGSAWTVAPPEGVEAFLRETHGRRWVPAAPSGAKEVRLDTGGAVRLTHGPFKLELSAPAAPVRAGAMLAKQIDWGVLTLLAVLGAALVSFITFLPPAPPQHPQEKEVLREVKLRIDKKETPPPKPKKPKAPDQPAPEKQAPAPIAQATTLKAAGAPLKSLEKITKATRGLSNLLASLDAAGAKGGKKSNTALIPTLHAAPGETAGMGGFGPCCAIGPITKGSEVLRSGGGSNVGALTGATAGQGGVAGVPVSMPARQAKVQGSYDRDALAKVINDHLNEIRSCYERALLRNPDIGAGKVQLEWTIAVDGTVGKVAAKVVTIKSNEVVACLLETIKEIKFPKPTGGEVIVGYPVLFNSVGY